MSSWWPRPLQSSARPFRTTRAAAKVLKKTDAKHVTNTLDEFYTSYGNPMVHRTDNGPPFNSHEFTDFSNKRGIQHELAYPYHPQANYAETFMKPLGKCLKIANLEGKDHETAVNQINFFPCIPLCPYSPLFTGAKQLNSYLSAMKRL